MHRREVLVLFVNFIVVMVGGALSALLGAFVLRPARGAGTRWIRAGGLADLKPNRPVPRVLAVTRQDGWYQHRARETVFLVWDGDTSVQALSAACTHLGCQVRWDAETTRFRCPCHGGVFDAEGRVLEGPPARPLDRVDARIDSASSAVLVRL